MLRLINTLFLGLLLLVLVALALANRDMVTLQAMPDELSGWLGVNWSLPMPLFLVILLSVLVGLVIGLVWEWLREAGERAEHARLKQKLTRAEQELDQIRRANAPQGKRDDILALLDDAK